MLRDKLSKETQVVVAEQEAQIRADFRNRYDRRLALAVAFARLSPAFAVKNASTVLAGTGLERQGRLLAQLMNTRQARQDWYWSHYMRRMLSSVDADRYGEYDGDLSDFPRFVYQDKWQDSELSAALTDIGVMALWSILFLACAFVAVLRYDVR